MKFFKKRGGEVRGPRWYQKRWGKLAIIIGSILLAILIGFMIKTGFILNKISGGNVKIFSSIIHSIPGVESKLEGEDQGRVNIMLLGMRGADDPNGGLLADTIMIVSLHPKQNDNDTPKVSMVSIPRDLYVTLPDGGQAKINDVYAEGEKKGQGQGLTDMRKKLEEITGQTIPYGVAINFQGFKDLVNALGGVDVTLNEPFNEAIQFNEPQVCDPYVFTVPTKPPQYQYKYYTRKDGTRYVAKAYPMCTNPNVECGGDFALPAGNNHLDGDKALCFARARYQTSDFARAARQQQVIQAIKDKALSVGTLSDFTKISALMDSLGNNVTSNLAGWEMKRFYELYQQNGDAAPQTFVLDNSDKGMLYAPEETKETGYILLPRGDNYSQIQDFFAKVLE